MHAPLHGKQARDRFGSCLLQFTSYQSPVVTFPSHRDLISVLHPQQACSSASGSASHHFLCQENSSWAFTWPTPVSAPASPSRNTSLTSFSSPQALSPFSLVFFLLSLSEFVIYLFVFYLSTPGCWFQWEPKLSLSSSPLCPKLLAHRNLIHICWMNDWIKGVWDK